MSSSASNLRVGVLGVVLVLVIGGSSFAISQYLISEAKVNGKDIAQKRTQEREHQEKATKHRENLLDILSKVETQLAKSPTDSMLIASAANISYDLGMFDTAETYYRLFLEKIDPQNTAAQIDLSYVLFQQGKNSDALAMMDGVVKREPNNQVALINKGYMLVQGGKIKEAVEVMKYCAKVDPNSEYGKTAIEFLRNSVAN
ncbi:MAG: hypothetical protein HQ472_08460 [Ignavibacteria bacterium]|nr:hypothetical protein [Ignavibacteria bacterium]